MKIAVLAPLAFPIREPYAGGLEKHTAQLSGGLSARGHTVTLLALPGTVAGGNVRLLPVDGYAGALRELHRGRYDIIHNNSLHYLPVLLGARLRTPLVTTLHAPPYRALRLAARLSRRAQGVHFVTISAFMQEQWGPYVDESTLVYNGIDPGEWPFSAGGGERRAVWSGRISPEKGVEYAVAAARAAGYRLDVAGPVHDRTYFEGTVAPLLDDRVRYHGALPAAELAHLYGGAEIGLFTSVWDEPFGLVIAEMLACGTPVAGFRSGAAPELITAGVGQLVGKRDVHALAAALATVGRLDREACRTHVTHQFPLLGMLEDYERLYTRILDR